MTTASNLSGVQVITAGEQGPPGPGSVFTYKEGATASGNIYATLFAAYTAAFAMASIIGYAKILVDGSLGAPVSGVDLGALDFEKIGLEATRSNATATTLTFQTGTTVTRFRELRGRLAVTSSSAAALCTISGAAKHRVYCDDESGFVGGSAAGPIFDVTGATSQLDIALKNGSFLSNGTGRVVQSGDGTYVIVAVGPGSFLGSTTLGGTGACYALDYTGGAGSLSTTQANVTAPGSYTVFRYVQAGNVTATDAAPLLGATTVQGQLDSIKRSLPIHRRAVASSAPGTNLYVNATPRVITLADNAKCVQNPNGAGLGVVSPAWARAGTGTLGQLTQQVSQTPGAGRIAVSNTGDILLNETDAYTSVDFSYLPERYDVVNTTYVCTPGTGVVAGLPSGMIFILEAEVMAGGSTGAKIVDPPAASAPAAGRANLTLGKTGVFFAVADAATSVRLKLGVIPAVDY